MRRGFRLSGTINVLPVQTTHPVREAGGSHACSDADGHTRPVRRPEDPSAVRAEWLIPRTTFAEAVPNGCGKARHVTEKGKPKLGKDRLRCRSTPIRCEVEPRGSCHTLSQDLCSYSTGKVDFRCSHHTHTARVFTPTRTHTRRCTPVWGDDAVTCSAAVVMSLCLQVITAYT